MTNYLTVNDFKSSELRKACEKADTNNSGGIDTDTEFKNLINSIHTNNSKNYCPKGHIYEGTEHEINLVHEAYDRYKKEVTNNFIKEYKDFTIKNKDLEKVFGKNITNIPIDPDKRLLEPPVDKRGLLPMIPDKSNDKAFIKSMLEKFIPLDSDLGKQIGRVTNEFRPEVDGKYEPVYSESDPLGRKEVIGYQPKNSYDIWY